jgi:hypothetical protein
MVKVKEEGETMLQGHLLGRLHAKSEKQAACFAWRNN